MRVVTAFAFAGLMVTGSYSAELKSIADVLAAEKSPAVISYVIKRCAAAYISMSSLMLVDGGTTEKSDKAGAMSNKFFEMSAKHADQNGMEFDAQAVTELVFQMASLYADEMSANFAATGNRIDGIFKEDTMLCREIYESWQ